MSVSVHGLVSGGETDALSLGASVAAGAAAAIFAVASAVGLVLGASTALQRAQARLGVIRPFLGSVMRQT